jgi:hypothetical protein
MDRSIPNGVVDVASIKRPFYVRIAMLGLLVIIVGGLILLINALLVGDGGFIIFTLVVLAIVIAFLAAIAGFGGWTVLLAVLGGALLILSLGAELPTYIAHPESFFDFAPSLLIVVGGLMAIVGGILFLVQRVRHSVRPSGTNTERNIVTTILGIAVILVVVSGIVTLASAKTVASEASSGATTLEMKNTVFLTEQLEGQAGTPTRVLLRNNDYTLHTFTIRDLGVDEFIGPRSERIIEIPAQTVGAHSFICAISGHEQTMYGTLTVK